ncbi:MAG: hypothetical protein ABSA13_10450 [Beijerinckiaceae bacterium]|jgi:hypothetical protein
MPKDKIGTCPECGCPDDLDKKIEAANESGSEDIWYDCYQEMVADLGEPNGPSVLDVINFAVVTCSYPIQYATGVEPEQTLRELRENLLRDLIFVKNGGFHGALLACLRESIPESLRNTSSSKEQRVAQ